MTNYHDHRPADTAMTDASLRQKCETLAASKGAEFALEPGVVSGCYPGVLADEGGYLAVITVRAEDPDDALHPWISCGRGSTPDDAMRNLLTQHNADTIAEDL